MLLPLTRNIREFVLDINLRNGKNPFLALNELKLWLSIEAEITGYDPNSGKWPGADEVLDTPDDPVMDPPIWDLGNAVVLMDYDLASGSGEADITFLVPSSLFATAEDCTYSSDTCTTYVVMWNEFGDYSNSTLYAERTWENNSGFEEWGTLHATHWEKQLG